MNTAREVAPQIGIAAACIGLGVARATFYRAQRPVSVQQANVPRASSPRALSVPEQDTILEWLHQPAYADLSPRTVFAMLLDAGRYLASVSTFYRLLRASGETRGRRNELTHPAYAKPELLATGPRELWSWDITKLKGPAKWVCFHLYVILDVFSRYVIGWMIAPRESAELAYELIAATCDKEGIVRGQLTLHADRGTSMRSKPAALFVLTTEILKDQHRSYWEPLLETALVKLPRPWIARSSSSVEDSKGLAFPGLFKTVLGLTCPRAVANSIDEIVMSLSSQAILSYAQFHSQRSDNFRMAVLVQHMLEPTASGVAFSHHPMGHKGTVAIEATYGLGSVLVDGTISPDLIEVDEDERVSFPRVGSKHLKAVFGLKGVENIPVAPDERLRPSISLGQARTLAQLARRLESELGEPQDVEWSIKDMDIYVLQSRPITTLRHVL